MTIHPAIPRPFAAQFVSWDGNNLAECQGIAPGCTVLANGTLLLIGGQIAQVGDLLTGFASPVLPIADFTQYYQDVPNGALAYAMVGDLAAAAPPKRIASVPVPAITLLNPKVTIPVVWPTPMPNTSYTVSTTMEAAAGLIGNISHGVVAGSKTVSGCSVAVSALLAVATGTITLTVRADAA